MNIIRLLNIIDFIIIVGGGVNMQIYIIYCMEFKTNNYCILR